MATIKFLVKGKTEFANILVRLTDGRNRDWTSPTDYIIKPQFWNAEKGTVRQVADYKEKVSMQENLDILKSRILEYLNEDKKKSLDIDKGWLEYAVKRAKNPELNRKQEGIIEIVKAYQDEMRNKINPKTRRPIASTTIRNFNTTIMRLEKFEEYKRKKYDLIDIDLTFLTDFKRFLCDKLLLSQNSVSKDVKQIKTVCIDARDKGFAINDQVLSRKFNAPQEETSFVTLTRDEIYKIKRFKGADYLENARDWLVVGCWTACRVGDLMKLTKDNILTTTKGERFIRYTQSKTGKQVDVPMHGDVIEIVERLNGLPRPISDVNFNKYIKIVCKGSGINEMVNGTRQNPITHLKETGAFQKWELVRSHTCRRSFATNHYNELPNKLIMAITGHSTEKMLLKYIGETEQDHISDFISLWNRNKGQSEVIIDISKKVV